VESYLNAVIPALTAHGHTVAFWHEVDEPVQRDQIALPPGTESRCVAASGPERALAELAAWHPDLIFTHGMRDLDWAAKTLRIAPAVLFLHSYDGTCISGAKTWKSPLIIPCSRRLSWRCLFHYYPHRCGGWNPLTMWEQYRAQTDRLRLLAAYRLLIVNSDYLRAEYIKHGWASNRVITCSCFLIPKAVPARESLEKAAVLPDWRLLFLGRMDLLKGGHVLLESLPIVQAGLDRPVRLAFVGDGPERRAWEISAAQLHQRIPTLGIKFLGWLNADQRDKLLAKTDLLVVPSLWPEPFGLVGIEAGWFGVPAAAFSVGGIPEWLVAGVNGHLASGAPPTARGLAQAICQCLKDTAAHKELCRGARQQAERFNMETHLTKLSSVFNQAIQAKPTEIA
jgi:glycosyltransferase involved in cell wall biosynthesis